MVSGRKQKLKARAAALSVGVGVSGSGGGTPTRSGSGGGVSKESRRQRKLGKQRERETKKRALVERELSLRVEKNSKPKKRGTVLALDGLGSALAEASALAKAAASKKGNSSGTTSKKGGVSAKARKHRVREESEQVANVLAHPAFMADPAEALRQHLLNTVCAEPSAVPAVPAEKANLVEKETKKSATMEGEKKAGGKLQLDAGDEAMEKARNEARTRLREKRQRKEELGRVAQERRKSMQGVRKVRVSPARGRIGVKRPKILEAE